MDIQNYLSNGYIIDQESDTYATLRKKKSVSLIEFLLVVVGFPLLFIFGIGLVLWAVAILNYIIKDDKVITVKKDKR